MAYLYLLISIIAEVIATTALKASDSFAKPVPSLAVVLCYACAFYFLLLVLREMSVSVAYAIWCGLGIVMRITAGLGTGARPSDKSYPRCCASRSRAVSLCGQVPSSTNWRLACPR
ncbi:MAG: multidrug efflux SMR transporter [Planctomycetota bacterium]